MASRRSSVVASLAAGQAVGFVAAVALLAGSSEAMPAPVALAWAVLAGASGVGGVGAFYLALSRATMGIVAPLTALIGAAVPAVIGIVAGEEVGGLRLVGLGVALAAVVLISLSGDRPGEVDTRARAARARDTDAVGGTERPFRAGARPSRGDAVLIVLAGLGFAGFFLGMDRAAAEGAESWWPILMVRMAGLSVVAVFVLSLVARRRPLDLRVSRRVLPIYLVAGAGDLGGNVFFLFADAAGSLPVAVVVSSLYPVVTALLARSILAERLTRPQLAGVAAAVLGVGLIAVGGTDPAV
jgi:drug/metabolite transporter (DMT)-like permease